MNPPCCPITLNSIEEISLPVAFASAPEQPYELTALCTWLERKRVNPLTGEMIGDFQFVLLGSEEQQDRSDKVLDEWLEAKVFRDELKELQSDLKKLGSEIERVNTAMDTLVAEKTRIERRVSRIYENHISRTSGSPCKCFDVCTIS